MKPQSLMLIALAAAGLAACQKSAPAPGTAAAPTPSPVTASAAPPSTTPAEAAAGAPAEAAPAGAPAPPAGPAAAAPAPRAGTSPQRAGDPLAPVGPATAANAPPAAVAVAPEPTPEPTPEPIVLAAGTVLPVRLDQTITTKTAQPEDRVVAVLDQDVSVGGKVVLPAGSEVLGSVVTALRSGRVKGRAQLVVSFDQIRAGRRTYDASLTGFDVTAGSSKGKDAKIAGGAAAAGAIIGAIADGGSGAGKGALIGGAAGGAAVLATRGKEVELPAGSRYQLKLTKPLRIR